MPARKEQSPETAFLCDRCSVLQLDDKKMGGRIEISNEGGKKVTFGSSDKLQLDYSLKDVLPDLPLLSASALSGCALCALIKEKLTNLQYKGDGKEVHIYHLCYGVVPISSPEKGPGLDALWIFFRLTGRETKRCLGLRLDVTAATEDPRAGWLSIYRRPLASHFLSEAGLRRLQELTQRAFQISKPSCSLSSYVPTRLIDVGDGQSREPRLIISAHHAPFNSDPQARRYVALSYCWGPPDVAQPQLKAEQETLKSHLEQIKMSKLPKTLQDAVQVCRALGIQYLWIDALCIIQDSKSDWEVESAQMADVYSNSTLTLCAAQGNSCRSGFLERRDCLLQVKQIDVSFSSTLDPSVSGAYSLTCRSEDELWDNPYDTRVFWDIEQGDLEYKDQLPSYSDMTHRRHEPFNDDIKYCAWNERGWTFQEGRCSPRMLLFGDRMAHIYVGNTAESEDGAYSDTILAWGESQKDVLEGRDSFNWRDTVSSYSSRELTFSTDVLPAFSAIAQSFSALSGGGKYLAGLWSTDLASQLLFIRHQNTPLAAIIHSGRSSESTYTAPSWSWASQPLYVHHVCNQKDRWEFKPEFNLVHADTVASGPSQYGQVRDGFLTVSAKICKLVSTDLIEKNGSLDMVSHFPYATQDVAGECVAHLRFDWKTSSVTKAAEDLDLDVVNQLYMALIARRANCSKDGKWTDDVFVGLLLFPTGTPSEYRRAGLFFAEMEGAGGISFWSRINTRTVRLI